MLAFDVHHMHCEGIWQSLLTTTVNACNATEWYGHITHECIQTCIPKIHTHTHTVRPNGPLQ